MRYCLILVLIIFSYNTSFSQSKRSLLINVGSSVAVRPSDFFTEFDKGFNVGGGIELSFRQNLYITAEANYNKFNAQSVSSRYRGSVTAITGIVNFKAITEDNRIPLGFFLKGGIGLYSLTASESSGAPQQLLESQVGPVFNLGGGMEFRISNRISIYGEVMYDMLFAKNTTFSYVPIKGGLKIGN